MQFVLNASTKVTFGGDRTLHACLMHKFFGQSTPEIQLVTEARQFSCYIVLIGRIASATLFEPKFGIIVQNKDEIKIPLDLEQIPTPKEFKDAIKSLSPEQQRFALAYRAMQLESTLFGICVIQIKPQLEKLLKLKPDSLTKEIRLTQDLMELFIKYQIPSDLLTFDGSESAEAHARLSAVKGHVKAIQDMIEDSKKKEVEAQRQLRAYDGTNQYDSYSDAEDEACSPPPESSMRMFKKESAALPKRSTVMMDKMCSAAVPSARKMDGCMPPPAPMMARPAAAPTICPSPSTQTPPPPQQQQQTGTVAETQATAKPDIVSASGTTAAVSVDYTQYPGKLDKAYELYDVDSALRPTIINPRKVWSKKSQKALLEAPTTVSLNEDALSTEKNAAFDLLDALSRSGALTIDNASLHIVIAATHCFDKSLMDTVIQKNVNPIERVERSVLIMAATVHSVEARELLADAQLPRVATYSPMLFLTHEEHQE
jgi:hypothetical protein